MSTVAAGSPMRRSLARESLRKACLAAGAMVLIAFPLIAYRSDFDAANVLVLTARWPLAALYCVAAFFGTWAASYYSLSTARRRAAAAIAAQESSAREDVRGRIDVTLVIKPLALGFALSYPFIAMAAMGGLEISRYWVDLGILILTYVMLGWGLNIVVGLAGLVDLGYVAFYAVGAYSYGLLSTHFGLSFWICLPLGGILAAFWGVLLGFPVLRLRGDYLAIVTLAFGEIIRLVLVNWVEVTGGASGVYSIPRATFFGIPFDASPNGFAALFGLRFSAMHRIIFLYYLILVLALVTYAVTIRLRALPVGRAWEALREDEIACRSLGINTTHVKLTAFAIGAAFGGLAGSFFAVRQGFISPESFTFLESAIILAIVVLGGMGSQLGIVVATLIMVGGPEFLRNLNALRHWFGDDFDPNQYRLLIFGLGMVVMMIWRPRGLVGYRQPSIVLRQRKAIGSALVKEGEG